MAEFAIIIPCTTVPEVDYACDRCDLGIWWKGDRSTPTNVCHASRIDVSAGVDLGELSIQDWKPSKYHGMQLGYGIHWRFLILIKSGLALGNGAAFFVQLLQCQGCHNPCNIVPSLFGPLC